MTTSRYPFWRTNPAGFAVTGYWPILTGCLAVLITSPFLGFLILGLNDAILAPVEYIPEQNTTYHYIASIALILLGSPLFSWAALIVAVPVSGVLAREGFAGWGVAALLGAVIGFIIGLILGGGLTPTSDVEMFTGCGILLALIYWGAIRVMHPTMFGVAFKPAP